MLRGVGEGRYEDVLCLRGYESEDVLRDHTSCIAFAVNISRVSYTIFGVLVGAVGGIDRP